MMDRFPEVCIPLQEMFKHPEVLALNRLYCNNIFTVEQTYGIEAARNVIIKVYIITYMFIAKNWKFMPLHWKGGGGGHIVLRFSLSVFM